jgi:type IX secretion system PorP/SprF family membrane protein
MRTNTQSVIKNLALAAIGLTLTVSASSQDIHFSQLFENPLSLNPALSGAFTGNFYAEANYKNQWNSVAQNGNGYTTMAATMEFHNMLKNWGSGYLSPGFSVFQDQSGDAHITQLEAAFTLASGIFLDDNNCISAGLQAGYSQNSITLGGLQWDDQYINGMYNSSAPTNENYFGNSFSYADFSGGVAYHYGTGQTNMSSNDALKFSAGAAIYHVNQPTMSYYGQSGNGTGTQLYMKYTGFANMEIGVPNSNLAVLPAVVYLKQGPAWEVDAGAKLRYVLNAESKYTGTRKGTALDLGVYYRVGDAAIALAGFEWGNYALGASYDFNTSALTTASHGAGGFEISLRFLNVNPFIQSSGAGSNRSMF